MNHPLIRKLVPRFLRNWLRNPSKSLVYVFDRLAYAVGSSPLVSPTENWTIPCHPAALDHFEIFRKDPIQTEELQAFVAYCRPGMQLLDVGAHYGFFSLACLHYAGADARVLCVEASAKAAGILTANLKLNHVRNQITLMVCAMGDHDGELEMLTTGPMGGDYFVVPSQRRDDTIKVQQRSLASLLKETKFTPTHVKIDIESFEYEVITASAHVLSAIQPVLFLEIHGDQLIARGKRPAEIVEILRECGYQAFILNGQIVGLDEMEAVGFNCRLVCLPSTLRLQD